MSFTPQTGQRVAVRKNLARHQGTIAYRGEQGTITQVAVNYPHEVFVQFDNHLVERGVDKIYSGWWSPANLVLLANESTPITFSLTTGTARTYAFEANSRILEPAHQAVLKAAANGLEVDLRAFQKAVTAALSSATTRKGQSMARRALATKIRHLAYIADAVLDKVLAEGLPLAGKVLAEPETIEVVSTDVMDALDAAKREVDSLKASLEEERATYLGSTSNLRHELARANERVDIFRERNVVEVKISEFARSLLDEVGRAKVEGFIEGLQS